MRSPLLSRCGAWIPLVVAVVAIDRARSHREAGGIVPPNTYEVQIDGESFLVDGNQPPVKVKSGLKKGTTYALAVRMAMTQKLRLNSVQLEYGMVATAYDNQGRDLRVRGSSMTWDLAWKSAISAKNWATSTRTNC